MQLADAAALAASALAMCGAVPQLVRLVRTRDAAGVSLAAATLGVATEAGWVAYCLHGALWSVLPTPAILVIVNLVLANAIVRTGAAAPRAVCAAGAWAVALAGVTFLAGWSVLGTVLALAYAVQVAPAIWEAYRTWAPSGLAPATWALNLVNGALWAVYAGQRGDRAILIFAAIAVGASTTILARWIATRHRFTGAVAQPATTVPSHAMAAAAPVSAHTDRACEACFQYRMRLAAPNPVALDEVWTELRKRLALDRGRIVDARTVALYTSLRRPQPVM